MGQLKHDIILEIAKSQIAGKFCGNTQQNRKNKKTNLIDLN